MLAETTHDTKRSAGVRARSLALAARSAEWAALVAEWTADHPEIVDAVAGPAGRGSASSASPGGGGLVHLALQTAATAQPLDAGRLGDYLVKAAREADLVTSWIDQDSAVEAALREIAAQSIDDATSGPLGDFVGLIERAGDAAGLGLLATQLTCPGFADLYQGSPRRLLTLVDPDNRSPVDWDELDGLVARVRTSDTRTAFAAGDVDLARATLVERVLRLRRRRPEAFGESAGYIGLDVTGPGAEHIVAYARTDGETPLVVVIVARVLGPDPASETAFDTVFDPASETVFDTVFDDVEIHLPEGTWRSLTLDDAAIEKGGRRRLTDLLNRPTGVDGVLRFEVLDRTDC